MLAAIRVGCQHIPVVAVGCGVWQSKTVLRMILACLWKKGTLRNMDSGHPGEDDIRMQTFFW